MTQLCLFITLAISLELCSLNAHEGFGLNRNYYALTAQEKQDYLWKNILSSRYKTLPPLKWQGWPVFIFELASFLNNKNTSFDDVRAARQQRVIFAHGTVAKVRFVSSDRMYNGIFERDSLGLIRCALLANPDGIGSYIPYVTIKFLIDESPGMTAGFMYSFEGQGADHRWFLRPLSNIINPAGVGPFAIIESMINKSFAIPNYMPISQLSKRRSDGRLSFENQGPYELILEPRVELENFMLAQTLRDFREELGRLPPDITLYDVKASDSRGGAIFTIGHIKLESEFVASDYGDTRITF